MSTYHQLHPDLIARQVNVVVVGAGGSGSHMVADLAVLHQSMLDLGHPEGLCVTVIDSDTVSAANVGRARFYAADVGASKAQTIVNRVNLCYGLAFRAIDGTVNRTSGESKVIADADIVIGCVDTRTSRRGILAALTKAATRQHRAAPVYWLDLGNGEHDGQVLLGEVGPPSPTRLPCITDLYPEMLDPSRDPVDNGPSCSRAEALARQSAFVNKAASMHAISMLAMLFRQGRIDHCGVFFNLQSGRTSVLACDPQAWERFGYVYKPEPQALPQPKPERNRARLVAA